MDFEISDKNKNRITNDVLRIIRSFPVAEALLENYLNSIDIFFDNLDLRYNVKVETSVNDKDAKPSTTIKINIKTEFENEAQQAEMVNAVNKVLNNTFSKIEEGNLSSETLTSHNQKMFFEINKFNKEHDNNLEEENG